MEIFKGQPKTEKAVYVQLRQAIRDKDGKLVVSRTKTRTIRNATIEEVWAVIEKGSNGKTKS